MLSADYADKRRFFSFIKFKIFINHEVHEELEVIIFNNTS